MTHPSASPRRPLRARATGFVRHSARAPRLVKVRWLIVYSTDFVHLLPLLGFLDLYLRVRDFGTPLALALAAGILLIVLVVLAGRTFRLAVRGAARPTGLLAAAGVITLPLAAFAMVYAIPVWLGMLAPFIRRRVLLAACVGTVALFNLALVVISGPDVQVGQVMQVVLLQSVLTVIMVGGVLANLWLWRVAREAHEGQEAKARLAVSEERLRFARDLNDLLGQSLAGLSARTANAERILRSDPEAAAAAMFEVRELTRQALREVRGTVQSYRALDLDEVLASVRAVLEAAGVRCAVDADTAPLAPETRTLLATVVREGATNVLKHSKAEHCRITIKDGVLEMSNDGVTGPVGDHAPDGLGGLARRVGAAGGTMTAEPTGEGAYLLRAAVPA